MNEAETRAELIDPKLKASGWGAVEGSKVLREFHITDDAALYHPKRARGLVPLVEGKQFHQFIFPIAELRYWIDPVQARSELIGPRLRAINALAERHQLAVTPSDNHW